MEIKDLAGISEPLKRLIDVVSHGIGAVFAPHLIRRTAEARAHEIRVISAALNDVANKHQLPVIYQEGKIDIWQRPEDRTLELRAIPLSERSSARLDYQERKRQHNIESVTSTAAAELSEQTEVPVETPDEDWISRFFACAQDVSSEQMQDLWGRILAGEIKRPGSYSLRTLDFVRNLTTDDAKLVEHVCRFALQIRDTSFIPVLESNWLGKQRGVRPGHQIALAELGVLFPTELLFTTFGRLAADHETFVHGDYLLLVKRCDRKGTFPIPEWKFTNVGQELLPLIPKAYDEEFLTEFGKHFVKFEMEALIGKITARLPNDDIHYDTIKVIKRQDTEEEQPGASPGRT